LDRHKLDGGRAERNEVRNFSRNVEKRSRFDWEVRCEERADVKLVDHEVTEVRRAKARFVPRKIGSANHAITGERRLEFASVRVAFRSRAAVSHDIKDVAVAILDVGDEPSPVAVLVTSEQARVINCTLGHLRSRPTRTLGV